MKYIIIFILSLISLIFIFFKIICVKNKIYVNYIPSNLSSRNDIGNLLEEEKFKYGIEVGVQSGIYADSLLSKWYSCRKYVMVDPWSKQRFYDDTANVDNPRQKEIFIESMKVVNKYNDRVEFVILRTTRKNALQYLGKDYYDFIYLDARHDYFSVKDDLEWYYPYIKSGGIFAGHDYQDENNNDWKLSSSGVKVKENKAVKSAVTEFAAKHKLNITTTNENNWKSWMIRKP